MFPVERKNEFLKYVMITKPYDKWSKMIYFYIRINNIKNWKEGFDFTVKYTTEPSWFAYHIHRDGNIESEWAKKVIENATSGDSPLYAYLMVRNRYAEPEWAKKIIENATIGDPSRAAYFMVDSGYATEEWLEEAKRKRVA